MGGAPRLARRAADASGAVALLFALLLPVLIGAGALALDAGHLYLQRRVLQGAADAAALAAAARPAEGTAIVRRVLDANGERDATFTLVFGRYEADASSGAGRRFVADPAGETARVEARLSSELHLARIFGLAAPAISAQADASPSPVASLAAGSRLAAVDPALLEKLLKPVLGVDIGLTAVDYTALARARIDLDGVLRAAAVVDARGAAPKAGDLLGDRLRIGPLLQAMASELNRSGEPAAASILLKAGNRLIVSAATARLADVLSLDADAMNAAVGASGIGVDAKLSVLGLLNGLLGSAAGEHPSTLSLSLPGIASADLQLQVGAPLARSRPLAVSGAMPAVETAQVRLRLILRTAGVLDLPNLRLEIPIELVVAGGSAQVIAQRCSSDPAAREVKVAVRPGVAKLALGAWSGPLSSASIASRPESADIVAAGGLASVKARALATLAPDAGVVLTFRGAEIGNGTTKTAASKSLAGGLASALMARTEIEVRVLAAGLPLLGLREAVASLLATAAAPLDRILDAVSASVGVSLGEMDVRVDDLACSLPRIVG